ncbi:unnamed protein product [Durusdinium trenchii]|uniref:Thioesterase domain-containing protein n=1 Tax=Durusdinium trenchii TaxID=1381693 RepID=A0ABP0HIN3_9DINO
MDLGHGRQLPWIVGKLSVAVTRAEFWCEMGRAPARHIIDELEKIGERVRYQLITGQGPPTGWVAWQKVSISLKGKELLRSVRGGQLPVMPRTIGLPTWAALPDKAKKQFPEKSRKPMIRLYCFPGAADNYMLWLELATSAPPWCEVAVYEPRAHGFRPDEAWDRSLEERAEDAFRVMRPAFETHASGGVSEGAPFGFLSHGVGGQFMALLAHRLKQELNLEPLVVFANDGPPPNVPTLSEDGYRCEDVLGFYKVFQPDTILQYEKMGGKGNKAAEALIQKWSRGLRLFEEHARRGSQPCDRYHQFGCDLHVLVAQHSVDMDRAFEELDALHPQRAWWEQRKKITGAAESGCNWDRDGFKKWAEWTAEPDDFHYHEVDTDHMTIKNSPLMRDIVFKELGGFCGMDD